MKRMRIIAEPTQNGTPNDGLHAVVGDLYKLQEDVYRQMNLTIPGKEEVPLEYEVHWNYMVKVVNALDPLIDEGIQLEEKLGSWSPE